MREATVVEDRDQRADELQALIRTMNEVNAASAQVCLAVEELGHAMQNHIRAIFAAHGHDFEEEEVE